MVFSPLNCKVTPPGASKSKAFTIIMKESITGPQQTTKHLEIYEVRAMAMPRRCARRLTGKDDGAVDVHMPLLVGSNKV